MNDRNLRVAVCVLAAAGAAIAGYLLYERWTGGVLVCSTGGCETVQHSRWSKLAGIPVATLGLAGYIGIFISVWIRGEFGRAIGFALSLVGFLFSMYLTYREAFTIHAYCQWCLGSAAIMTLLAILTTLRMLRTDGETAAPRKPADRAERRRQMAARR